MIRGLRNFLGPLDTVERVERYMVNEEILIRI